VEKIVLTPFMINYAEEAIDRASKDNFSDIICKFFMELLR